MDYMKTSVGSIMKFFNVEVDGGQSVNPLIR
jgi:hypothetical protein